MDQLNRLSVSELQRQLREERLKTADLMHEVRVLHQFIGVAGHDLKTPITTLKTSLYLLHRKPELATPDRLNMMSGQLDRLSNLVEAMCLMSRLENLPSLEFDETSVDPVIDEAIRVVQDDANEKDIQLKVKLPQTVPPTRVNFEELKRALVNLLDNAIRYSERGENVLIDVFEMHGYLCLDVVDHGVGLTHDEVQNLFQPFYRGHDAGNASDKGAGMGLAIVRRIVELHDGKMRVNSTHGKGATFRIMLPIT